MTMQLTVEQKAILKETKRTRDFHGWLHQQLQRPNKTIQMKEIKGDREQVIVSFYNYSKDPIRYSIETGNYNNLRDIYDIFWNNLGLKIPHYGESKINGIKIEFDGKLLKDRHHENGTIYLDVIYQTSFPEFVNSKKYQSV